MVQNATISRCMMSSIHIMTSSDTKLCIPVASKENGKLNNKIHSSLTLQNDITKSRHLPKADFREEKLIHCLINVKFYAIFY